MQNSFFASFFCVIFCPFIGFSLSAEHLLNQVEHLPRNRFSSSEEGTTSGSDPQTSLGTGKICVIFALFLQRNLTATAAPRPTWIDSAPAKLPPRRRLPPSRPNPGRTRFHEIPVTFPPTNYFPSIRGIATIRSKPSNLHPKFHGAHTLTHGRHGQLIHFRRRRNLLHATHENGDGDFPRWAVCGLLKGTNHFGD